MSQSDKLLRGEGYSLATDATAMTTYPSDIVERLRDHANEIVATLGQATGGPLMTKCDAVRYVETYLRETYVAEITRLRAALDEAFIQGLENAEDILRRKVEHLRQSRL